MRAIKYENEHENWKVYLCLHCEVFISVYIKMYFLDSAHLINIHRFLTRQVADAPLFFLEFQLDFGFKSIDTCLSIKNKSLRV